ncbi:hypothetical protein H6F47_07635 [Sphaerospermopsis sp. FACHB-1094]|uniref:hypothetical protein n=1 Tax=Sphaerospermopsis sp. FACHB-1094 TaxID=2692861 RepID=UPI00168208B4|nr:hypothetical protein [Sphaerospermopsis sp. FACHB-1094]MBD2132305.1 hypothetical protein [Sphaerospermopsis sp. FACHB-1094]
MGIGLLVFPSHQSPVPHKGRYFTLSSGQDLVDKVDKVTREENSTKSVFLVTKIVRQKTIVRIKSSLSTFLPCLPSPASTDNIKNLPLSGPQSPVPSHQSPVPYTCHFGKF